MKNIRVQRVRHPKTGKGNSRLKDEQRESQWEPQWESQASVPLFEQETGTQSSIHLEEFSFSFKNKRKPSEGAKQKGAED